MRKTKLCGKKNDDGSEHWHCVLSKKHEGECSPFILDSEDHTDDRILEVYDNAVTVALNTLKVLLPCQDARHIAQRFIHHVELHMTDELTNIADHGHRGDDPDYDPDAHAKTREQKAMELAAMIAGFKTEEEFGDDQPEFEDWISTVNDLIATARKAVQS